MDFEAIISRSNSPFVTIGIIQGYYNKIIMKKEISLRDQIVKDLILYDSLPNWLKNN